jgi:hypothetical protein
MRSRGAIEALLIVLAATALAIAFTYPVAFNFDQIGRVNTDDGRWSIWVVSWVAHALTTEPSRLYHANIFYPHQYTLAYSEANLGAGVIGAPVWAITHNPYATHNAAFLAAFVLAFTGAYYLARYLVVSRGAAFVAGLLFAFCPFMFARTAHIQLLFIGAIPLCMLAFHRLVDGPTVGRAATLGISISATALTCAYYGIFAALMIGLGTFVYAISRGLWRSRDYWIGIALAAFTSIGLTLPFFLPYLEVQSEGGFVRTLDDAREYSANLSAWAASAAWAHRWWLPAVPGYNEVLFPGLVATVLGVAGVWALRRQRDTVALYLLIGVFAFWSSFGPDAGLYRAFYEAIPIFSFLRAPSRMGVLVTLSLVIFAAATVAWLESKVTRPLLLAGSLSVLATAELFTAPLNQFRLAEPTSPVYRVLATLPRGAVAEFPFWYERYDFPRHASYMLNSTSHWQPLINGYSDHIPDDFRKNVIPLSSFPSRESFHILARLRTRYVVFHLDMYNSRSRERLLQRLQTYSPYLRPIVNKGPVWLFEIADWPN